MQIARRVGHLRAIVSSSRSVGTVGLVPTMGAFHDGHVSLISAARAADATVVTSIFVNPLQFGPGEDFDAYPRSERRDLKIAREQGVDVVFLPSVEDMYPWQASTRIDVGPPARILEGALRPGHFDGVCTVVAKLFNIVGPDRAYFGQKDAQQVAVIRRMVRDLDVPVELVVCPTVREADGLAMSSRNTYLDSAERRRATSLFRALQAGKKLVQQGHRIDEIEAAMSAVMREGGVVPDYAKVVDPDTFGEPVAAGPVLLAVAARAGTTRLIDNLMVEVP